MEKQIIISISREFGSGGHTIAERIAKDLGLKFYDHNMLDDIAREKGVDFEKLMKYDEKPKNRFTSRRIGEHDSAMEEHVAQFQFAYLKKKAKDGESFVVVGRCAETVLQDYDNLISIFIVADQPQKVHRVKEKFRISEKDALAKMRRHDRYRKYFHNQHSTAKWGDPRNYDLCINSNKLGIEQTTLIIEDYIRTRISGMNE